MVYRVYHRRRTALIAGSIGSALLCAACLHGGPSSGNGAAASPDTGVDSRVQDAAAARDADTSGGAAELDALDTLDCDADAPVLPRNAPPAVAIVGEWSLLPVAPVHLLSVDRIPGGEWLPASGTEDSFVIEEPGTPTRRVAVRFDAPGRYQVDLRVTHECSGDSATGTVSVGVVQAEPSRPRATSSSVAFSPDAAWLAALSEDGGAVTLQPVPRPDAERPWLSIDSALPTDPVRVEVCDAPAQLAWGAGRIAITCPASDELVLLDPSNAATVTRTQLRYGARPWGVVHMDGSWWVTLQGTGEVVRFEPGLGAPAERWAVVPDARAIAELGDGRLVVSRWRATDDGNMLAILDPQRGDVSPIALPRDEIPSSDTETGGVPTFVQSLAVSTREPVVYAGAVLANVHEGTLTSSVPLRQDTTLRAVLLTIDVDSERERVEAREVFDDRGYASSVALSPASDFAYLTMRGARTIERYDLLTGTEAGTLVGLGYAPTSIAVSGRDAVLAVDVALERHVALYDGTLWSGVPRPVALVPLVTEEPLPAQLLLGKRLFNDSFDQRLTQDGYIACAHCHLDGSHDGLSWDFSDRGEGVRSTIPLTGRAGTSHGLLHWTANFDEIHDFEHDLRGPFGGRGLMSDADFAEGRDEPLGAPKAGLSEDLDALAAYVTSLDRYPRSPHRLADGALSAAARRGRTIFESDQTRCTTCHVGPRLTDSGVASSGEPILHDVGTLSARSGSRLGQPLTGLDTPTLHGVFESAPYLHDGSAPSLHEVLTTRNGDDEHGHTSTLSSAQVEDLIAYLLSLDGRVD